MKFANLQFRAKLWNSLLKSQIRIFAISGAIAHSIFQYAIRKNELYITPFKKFTNQCKMYLLVIVFHIDDLSKQDCAKLWKSCKSHLMTWTLGWHWHNHIQWSITILSNYSTIFIDKTYIITEKPQLNYQFFILCKIMQS